MARLREMLGHDVPALILTGDISTQTLREIDAQGYVHRSKPIGSKELIRLIQNLLATRRGAALGPSLAATATTGAADSVQRLVPPSGIQGALAAPQPATVFVVDDNADLRTAMKILLAPTGYAVQAFETAEAFLAVRRRASLAASWSTSTCPA